MADYLALYVFVRTDLQSMTPGKAQAHSGHAANHFVYNHYINSKDVERKADIESWMKQANGFGTQINLKGSWQEVMQSVDEADTDGFITGIVIDPTYPYIVNSEIRHLIAPATHMLQPVEMSDGNYMCFRREATAAYVFGYKEALQPYLSRFPLHP
jgi:exo-beta-1,3-glucanase (GH17 family)